MGRVALVVTAALLAAGASRAQAEVLRVGMDTRSRPWAYVPGLDYSREDYSKAPRLAAEQIKLLEGLDIDFLKALERRLGASLVIVPTAWETIEQGLLGERFDLLVNAWVPSTKTPKQIVASAPYYWWGLIVAIRSDDQAIRSYRDLGGRTVGHFRDAVVDRTVTTLGAKRLVPMDDSDALFAELEAGRLDAVLEDTLYVRWRVARDAQFRTVGEPLNRHGYHVGLRRADTALLERVQEAIRDLVAAGEIERLRTKWEGP